MGDMITMWEEGGERRSVRPKRRRRGGGESCACALPTRFIGFPKCPAVKHPNGYRRLRGATRSPKFSFRQAREVGLTRPQIDACPIDSSPPRWVPQTLRKSSVVPFHSCTILCLCHVCRRRAFPSQQALPKAPLEMTVITIAATCGSCVRPRVFASRPGCLRMLSLHEHHLDCANPMFDFSKTADLTFWTPVLARFRACS